MERKSYLLSMPHSYCIGKELCMFLSKGECFRSSLKGLCMFFFKRRMFVVMGNDIERRRLCETFNLIAIWGMRFLLTLDLQRFLGPLVLWMFQPQRINGYIPKFDSHQQYVHVFDNHTTWKYIFKWNGIKFQQSILLGV